MKLLVLSGCAHLAFVHYLKATHPDWDIRAVVPVQAEKWLAEKHEGFLGFLADLDIFVGLTDRDIVNAHLAEKTQLVPLPSFSYFGHHPDVIFMKTPVSVMERGNAQSRLALAGWLSGLSCAETETLFTDETYARLGYYDRRATARAETEKAFVNRGLDISGLMDRWIDEPGFLYYPSHPRIALFFDLAHLAMVQAGHPPEISDAALAQARADTHDYLADGVHWPIYPEVAAHHGIAAIPADWRSSAAKGKGEHFGLTEMIRRSYAIYDANAGLRDQMQQALGGPDEVARYVNRGAVLSAAPLGVSLGAED